ncbi:MAG TPA: DUF1127 domain-containing protein [Candidatus Acidoferrum sp.]|nr:DUF1127 domain-containing protein [Candidatus Acidoferrum sp.]
MSATATTLNSNRLSAVALVTMLAPAARAAALLASWRRRAADRRQLASLDGHMLRDIGLSFGDVDVEVSKPFWRG